MHDVTVMIPFWRERGSKTWLEECVTAFPTGTKYLVAENDGDLAGAMNEALALVDTEWMMAFGHDDVPADDMLDKMFAVSEDADVIYPTMVLTDDRLRTIGMFNADVFCGNRLQTWNFVSGGFLARTETVRQAGGWRDLETFEDWDLHVRMFRQGARFKACPQAEFLYRQHDSSRQHTQTREFESVTAMRRHWQDMIVGEPPDVDATFYYQATPATSYWRCILPARYLPGTATSVLDGVLRDGGGLDLPDHRGAAVFQFPADNERAGALLELQKQGIRYLVEVDDNYLDGMDPTFRTRAGWTLTIGQSKAEWRSKPHSVEGHRWITERADGVIVTTKRLAEIYGEVNANVYVCRNSIDPDDWPELVKPDDGVFRIGWFASRSHDRDADLVRKALSWASRQPGVEVVTVGLDPAGWDFTRHHFPWADDFTAYRRLLMRLDVGVAPVLATSSALCRSDLKVLEYAMAGAVTVAQRAAPYEEWFDGPCLPASTASEFVDRIRWCVRNQDAARALGREARELVLRTRTVEAEIPRWRAAVDGA